MKIVMSRRGGIITGMLAAVAVLVCAALALALYIVHNVRIEGAKGLHGENVSIETPAGTFSVRAHEKISPDLAGIPAYPGARHTKKSGGAVLEWTSRDGGEQKGMTVAGSEMITPDPASKVVDYYREQLPDWVVVQQRDGTTRIELSEHGYKRIIAIKERWDGTHIGVASIGEPVAN